MYGRSNHSGLQVEWSILVVLKFSVALPMPQQRAAMPRAPRQCRPRPGARVGTHAALRRQQHPGRSGTALPRTSL